VPQKFQDKLAVPIAIPVWSLVMMLVGGIFTAGVTFQKLDALIAESKATNERVSTMWDRQIGGLEKLQNHEVRISNVETRLGQLERQVLSEGRAKQ
jgi:hypothetical protein